jgi:hypothetical protein
VAALFLGKVPLRLHMLNAYFTIGNGGKITNFLLCDKLLSLTWLRCRRSTFEGRSRPLLKDYVRPKVVTSHIMLIACQNLRIQIRYGNTFHEALHRDV